MFCGFDYGTSNCAIGIKDHRVNNELNSLVLPLYKGQPYVPSTLFLADQRLLAENVYLNISNEKLKKTFYETRQVLLEQSIHVKVEHDIRDGEKTLFVGEEAVQHYIDYPDEGYFVKSPKSFLGATGLQTTQVQFFEDIVTAMMQSIVSMATDAINETGEALTHTVVGRPVNFQGMGGEESNRQALEILTVAAKRSGFEQVEFLYEPLAAGIDFETRMDKNQMVMVVDIGGGTTDCSMLKMGPDHINKTERASDFLGHSGQRIGGNDLDIHLSFECFMPEFGLYDHLKTGLPMPNQPFWKAVKVNDVGLQTEFYSTKYELMLKQLLLDTNNPKRLDRLVQMRKHKQNHRLVRCGEQTKIALSDHDLHDANLSFIEDSMCVSVSREAFTSAIEQPIKLIMEQMSDVINQSGVQPDIIYITGGSAKSPVILEAIRRQVGDTPIVDGDYFGSVTAGLTRWAERIFK